MERYEQIRTSQSDPERLGMDPDTPFIYVTSIADYMDNVRHSAWINAAQPAATLWAQIQELMAASPNRKAPEPGEPGWFIEDKRGFYDYGPDLGHDTMEIANIGHGISLYGEPFAAYAMEHSGGEHGERLLTEFEEFYVASFPDAETCIDEFLDAMGWSQALDAFKVEQGIDCPLEFDRSCIWERYKEAWEVIETRNGAVHVFNN